MATTKSFQLYINEDNVKQYFTTSGGALNGAAIGGKYITMRTSSTTARFTMNDAGRDVLFPSAAAIAHKVDVWAQTIATLNNSKNTINVAITGQNAIATERIRTSLTEHTGSVSGSFTKSNTSAIYVVKIANSFHAAGVRDTSITAYFTQYACAANKSGNGVKNVSVSNAAPYEGETVTFSAELYTGANFEGWYSDEACTQLVSSNLTYSTTAADLTLYAKATIDANLYNVSAVAGSEITSVSVSDSIVPDGDTVTFTAQINTGCSFEAWYSDDTYTTIVSTENPYTATITANTTLYAKAHKNSLNMSVGFAEHGTASISATTVPYGNDVTFTFTPEDETWELYGWYSDSGFTQLVSEANPYTFTATENVTLYPKVGKKRYTITLKRNQYIGNGMTHHLTIASLYEDQLTDIEREYIKTGEFSKIDQAKIFDITTVDGNDMTSAITATLKAPKNLLCVLYSKISGWASEKGYYLTGFALNKDPGLGTNNVQDKVTDPSVICPWNYYSFYPKASDTYYVVVGHICDCFAIAKDGIAKATVPTHVMQYAKAPFSAELSPGYTFAGWYSDEACTQLVSTDNPAQITCPAYTTKDPSSTSLTLYAKGTKATYTIGVGTVEHGSASVSATTAYYGDTVTFNCTVDEGYEFKGWYSDEGLTQLVSESNPYTHSVTGNVTLYPKVEKKRFTITVGQYKSFSSGDLLDFDVISFYYDRLTKEEVRLLRTGEFDNIDQSKVIEKKSASGNAVQSDVIATILCPSDAYIAIYAKPTTPLSTTGFGQIKDSDGNYLTYWPYYWYQPSEDAFFEIDYLSENYSCNCSAIAKDGIDYAYATTPTRQEREAIFEAEVSPGYTFSGWYTDEACTRLSSTDNPAYIKTPKYITSQASATSVTLYAKAIKHTVIYTVQVGSQPDDGNASVNASTATYGDVVTFTVNITKANREFYGWYKDAAHTQLVSPDATYVATITSDTTLYPLIGKTRYTKIIHPVKLFDALPYRGLVNGANPSQSIPADVSKITNIGLDQATSTVFAYQPHSTAIDFTHGMSIWFGANPIPEMPDNATIIGIQAKFGYSLGDGDYSSVKIGFGRFEYVSDNDETPITGSGSYAYTGESDETSPEDEVLLQSYLNANYLVNRASNFSNPMLNANTTYDLTIESGTNVIQATVTVPINNPEEYPTSVANLKAGKLGFQINCKNKSTNASNRMLRLHAFDLYITYTIEDVSYKCDAISDGYTDVVIQSRDVAPGVENTWIARSIGGYRFDGWYSDPERTNLVSTQQEYITTITAPLTLYAKSHYHSRVITRVLDIPMGKGNTYFIGMDTNNNVLSSETSGSGWKADFKASDYGWLANIGGISDVVAAACMTNKSSTPYTIKAVLNTAAKDILFPNNTAHMVRLDSNAELGRAAISARLVSGRFKDPVNGNDYITPCFDGICGSVWRPNMIHNVNMVHTNIRHNWVLNVTKQSEIGYLMHQSSSSEWRAEGINNITLTGYFEEYDFSAQIANNAQGIDAVACSQAIGYEGDSVTYTVTLSPGVIWNGWYADPNCKTLVSTEQTYTTVPNSNLTLYAKASTELTTGTGVYIKCNGTFVAANAVYKKINGAWVQQSDPTSLFNGSPSGTESNYIYLGG